MKYILPLIGWLLIGSSYGTAAEAHRLNVFAWLENEQILVDCNFGQNRPAANAVVTVLDGTSSKEILDGHTTAEGRFSFPVPEIVRHGHSLIIQVNAGQGHQGQWTMDASELYAAASLAAGFEDASIKDHQHREGIQGPNPPFPAGQVTSQQIATIVQAALETHLAPIRRQLAEASRPGIVEILGGLGWITGLVGVGLYFKGRRDSR